MECVRYVEGSAWSQLNEGPSFYSHRRLILEAGRWDPRGPHSASPNDGSSPLYERGEVEDDDDEFAQE